MMFTHLVSVFASLAVVSAELRSQTFELPKLIIHVDHLYLQRNEPAKLSCQIAPGWSEARMSAVKWMKDGIEIEKLSKKDGKEDFHIDGPTLIINGGKQQSEGDYQCVADLTQVKLSNGQYIATKLVSPPVKLRRARITKFDKTTDHVVRAKQGEVARLPCVGMPDVIPGPPEICFEKEGQSEKCLGAKSEPAALPRYLSTTTGLQIALVQPVDSGKYFCVVRNDYTNHTRKSTKHVHLIVEPAIKANDEGKEKLDPEVDPQLVFPTKGRDKPIVVDVVAGQDIILECIFTGAVSIEWTRENGTMPPISTAEDGRPFRQLWGNLRIKGVSQGDAGVYACHGLNVLKRDTVDDNNHIRISYNLVVHAPTAVNLSLTQDPTDNNWKLSCLAINSRYEIPMAFVNATALISAIDLMGVPSSTNFYTNPINVTFAQVKHSFSGSVQCISRPAMDEAEIYGNGLERGRSANVYVMSGSQTDMLIHTPPVNSTSIIGSTATLVCLIAKSQQKFWKFKNSTHENYVTIIGNTRIHVKGGNSLTIQDVRPEDEGWYTCHVHYEGKKETASAYLSVVRPTTTIPMTTTTEPFRLLKKDENVTVQNVRGFVTGRDVRVLWDVLGNTSALARVSSFRIELRHREGKWMEANSVESHVRATTIRSLIPNAQYQFRIKAVRDDGVYTYSAPTDLLNVNAVDGDVKPVQPKIDAVDAISSTSLRVKFTHEAPLKNSAAKSFMVFLTSATSDQALVKKVDGSVTEVDIDGLRPVTEYTVHITAENDAGKSAPSKAVTRKTLDISMENGLFDMLGRGIKQVAPNADLQTIVIILVACFVALVLLLICVIVICQVRSRSEKVTKAANGKFLDTSYRIFNEQKVHKSKLNATGNLFSTDDVDECSPLKMNGADRISLTSGHGFTMSGAMPNLYGNVGEEVEEESHGDVPNDPNYVNATKITNQGIYGTTTARCYSPDSGTSHEMLMPFASPNLMTGPLMTSSPQRVVAYKCPDSLLYSPAGTASSSLGDGSSSGQHTRLTCDSPINPPTDTSDQGIRCGGSSRNSQISSTDGNGKFHTFKAPHPNTTSFMGTFDRRPEHNVYGMN